MKKYWWIMVIAILAVLSIAATLWGQSTIQDPNANYVGRNDSDLREYTNGDMRIFLSGMDESLNSSNFGVVEFWVNRTLLENGTLGYILYYDGSHSQSFNESIPLDKDDLNERNWWTGYQLFNPNKFDPFQPTATDTYTILRQPAGSEILYQLRLQTWNGTNWNKESYNRTYTVLFAPGEVRYEIDLYLNVFYYISIDCVLLIVLLLVSHPWRPVIIVDDSKKDVQDAPFNLEVSQLITRAGHLEAQIGGLRTGASILLTLGTGIFLTFAGSITISVTFIPIGIFILAPVSLILFSFFGFIWSFASVVAKENGHRLEMSLLPNGLSEEIYKRLLVKAVQRREAVLEKAIGYVRSGLIVFFTCALWGTIQLILPNVELFMNRSTIQLPYWISVILTFFVSVIIVITINRRLKLDLDETR